MHGAKNIVLTDGPSPQKREFPVTQEINYEILRYINFRIQEFMSDS